METRGIKMYVKEVLLPGDKQDIMVIGTELRGHLMFDTYFYWNLSNLNALINALQKENQEDDISELFTACQGINGSRGFQLDASKLRNNCIDFQFLAINQQALAIRA